MSIKVPITVWSEVQSLQSHQVCTGFTSVQSCPYMAKLDPMSGPPRFDHIHPEPDRIQLCDAQHKLCHVISNVTTLKFLAPWWIWRINPSRVGKGNLYYSHIYILTVELIMEGPILHELIHKQPLRTIIGEAQESHQIGMPYLAHEVHFSLHVIRLPPNSSVQIKLWSLFQSESSGANNK